MNMSNEELHPNKNRDLVSILSNLLLVLFTVLFLWIAFSYYEDRIQAVTLDENRYLTTEWQLLEELKAQTDEQLAEKEREIAELQRKYNELRQQNASDQELKAVQNQIAQAKDEKELILSQRIDQSSTAGSISPAAINPSINSLLEQKVKKLEHELEQSRQKIEQLRNNIEGLNSEHRKTVQQLRTENRTLSNELTQENETQSEVLEELIRRLKMLDRVQTPDMEDINTRVLLKAIVSSPTVRSEYPQLQTKLDRYFQILSNQHLLEGRQAAYREAIELIEQTPSH